MIRQKENHIYSCIKYKETNSIHSVQLHKVQGNSIHSVQLHKVQGNSIHSVLLHKVQGNSIHSVQLHKVQGNSIHSLQSSLNSHPTWATLYKHIIVTIYTKM